MIRFLLFALFFLILAPDSLGLNVGLAPGLSVKNAFLYLIVLALAADTALQRNRRIELGSVIGPYLLFFLYALFSWLVVVLIVHYPGYNTLSTLISLKGGIADHLLVLGVFFYGVLQSDRAAALGRAILYLVMVSSIATLVDDLNIPNLGIFSERYDSRSVGPVGEPNQYAAFLVLFIPPLIALTLREKGPLRIFIFIGAVSSFLALLLTASRGGLVGLFMGIVFGAFFLRREFSARALMLGAVWMLFIALLSGSLLVLSGHADVLAERILGMFGAGNAYEMSSGRTYLWSLAINKMIEQPWSLLIGFGWDTYRYFPDFYLAPHNTYLKIFFELGLVGVVLILVTIGRVLIVARVGISSANPDESAMLKAFVFGFIAATISIFFLDLANTWILIWGYVGISMRIAVASTYLAQPKGRESESRPLKGNDLRSVGPA